MLIIFRWFAYDSDYIVHVRYWKFKDPKRINKAKSKSVPNRYNPRFKSWTMVSLHSIHLLKETLHSFETLLDKHGLARNEFHRYLQLRSYIDHESKLTDLSDVESEFNTF